MAVFTNVPKGTALLSLKDMFKNWQIIKNLFTYQYHGE
jgi:hypothetical protein